MTKKLLGSSRRGRLRQVRSEDITFTDKAAAELAALKHRKIKCDKEHPEFTAWDKGEISKFYRTIKKQITIRLDADVLNWFKCNFTIKLAQEY